MAFASSDSVDPRASRLAVDDIRPHLRVPGRGIPTSVIIGVAVVAAIILFAVLDGRRRSLAAPTVKAGVVDLPGSDAPPPLYIPSASNAPEPVAPLVSSASPGRPLAVMRPRDPIAPQVISAPVAQTVSPPLPPRVASGQALVIDGRGNATGGTPSSVGRPEAVTPGSLQGEQEVALRARASVIANRAMTVPQGTLIPAVLETGFDSTRPGFARALVQRDVHGFDGTQVLIPRGSRLIGEYSAEVAQGQSRAMIAWTRLIRPDGVSIAIRSPAADPVGRGGIKAKVNSHFLTRFAGAILQSALDVGVNLATRRADTSVIVAAPGSLNNATNGILRQNQVAPTLTVAPGKSISVFVARDLDFSDTEPPVPRSTP